VCQMLTIPHEASHKTGESSYLQEESREARKVPWSSLQFLVSTAELSAEQVVYTHYVRMPSSMAFAGRHKYVTSKTIRTPHKISVSRQRIIQRPFASSRLAVLLCMQATRPLRSN